MFANVTVMRQWKYEPSKYYDDDFVTFSDSMLHALPLFVMAIVVIL